MNDDFSSLEAELKRMRPAQPSSQLRERLLAGIAKQTASNAQHPTSKSTASWRWVFWPSLAAAAVLIVSFVHRNSPPGVANSAPVTPVAKLSTPASSSVVQADELKPMQRFKPVAADRVILAAQTDGLVTFSDGTLARRVRQVSVDTYTWRDPKTNSSLSWSIPREDIRVVPASFH